MNSTVVANGSELVIVELSPTEWRVSDCSIEEGNPSAILGFICQIGTFFEVVRLDRWRERTYFSSFVRATETLAAGIRQPVLA